ncbi:hypothetical protein TCDM_12164 [Trypanosoma cruzi Dm28c]|uniref:Uncharacterized protein n=1 Tax=Trypanosoma cruzi Dm28c TaxID=1416333 RepID=V5CYL6_TRYCR|nr:hypothetical protein TCDM_12164 [Trypanosoma cruzi Dm28c]
MHRKAATSIPLPRDAVINGLERVCGTTEIPHNHNHAPAITLHRIIPWDAVGCNNVEFYQPRFANDASDDDKRTAFNSIYISKEIIILNYGQTVLHHSLHSHLDPLHHYTAPQGQMVSLWRSIVQQPAYSHAHREQSALPLKIGFRHLIPPRPETSQSSTQTPVSTDSLSATEAPRAAPLAVRECVAEEIWAMLLSLVKRGHPAHLIFPHRTAVPHAMRPLTKKPR